MDSILRFLPLTLFTDCVSIRIENLRKNFVHKKYSQYDCDNHVDDKATFANRCCNFNIWQYHYYDRSEIKTFC